MQVVTLEGNLSVKLSPWITSILVIHFDETHGQIIRCLYPGDVVRVSSYSVSVSLILVI